MEYFSFLGNFMNPNKKYLMEKRELEEQVKRLSFAIEATMDDIGRHLQNQGNNLPVIQSLAINIENYCLHLLELKAKSGMESLPVRPSLGPAFMTLTVRFAALGDEYRKIYLRLERIMNRVLSL